MDKMLLRKDGRANNRAEEISMLIQNHLGVVL